MFLPKILCSFRWDCLFFEISFWGVGGFFVPGLSVKRLSGLRKLTVCFHSINTFYTFIIYFWAKVFRQNDIILQNRVKKIWIIRSYQNREEALENYFYFFHSEVFDAKIFEMRRRIRLQTPNRLPIVQENDRVETFEMRN